ncbi:hypothetical protein Tco_0917655 [Tanacetum coccineum]
MVVPNNGCPFPGSNTMANVNVDATAEQAHAMAPPTRTDDQILPRIRWVPVQKSNLRVTGEDVQCSRSPFEVWEMARLAPENTMADVNVDATAEQAPAMAPPTRTDDQILPRISMGAWFERPRAPVLQILWGVINRAHIDYVERMWEEFTQSIHTFTEDKKNLTQHTQGKKKATLIVIPSVRFTKLIIFYLQRKHKFHPRPGSPLHLPNEEPVLGYLKFSAKGTKWEVFGMPIPNDLITDDIRGEQYYNAYLEKVAKHKRYLAGEDVSDPDSPAPKPAKATKPKATKQSNPLAPKAATKKPKPAPVKPKEKKHEFVDEGVPNNEPRLDDEEAATQRAIEESLKEVHDTRQGPLPLVVIREPDFGILQTLPEAQGKGKEKVIDKQAAKLLLKLQTSKKKNPADQFVFQRRTSTPTESSSHDESSLLYAELGLTDNEGQAGPNPGDAAVSQPPSSHVVLAGPNLEHMNLEISDTSVQPNPEQMDEEFTTTAYPNVQENLKLPTEDEFLVEKSQEDEPKKTNIEAEVQSMVTVPIHQDTSSVPLMTTPVIDLTASQPASTTVQAPIPTSTATVTAITTTTTLPQPPQPQQGSSDSILI